MFGGTLNKLNQSPVLPIVHFVHDVCDETVVWITNYEMRKFYGGKVELGLKIRCEKMIATR